MATHKILAVDDDESMLKLLTVALESGGYRVTTAPSGENALTLLKSFTPDLIIADVLMPGMKGYEFCRKVREMKNDAVPFIFCSALGDHPERVRGLRAGADDYIVKPINGAELLLKVEKLIEKDKKLRDMARKCVDATPKGIMSGTLENVWVGDILQVFNYTAIPKACLTVTAPGNKKGEIYIEDRQFTHAQTGNITGMKALIRILSWKEGAYTVETRAWPRERTLSGALDQGLMEGAVQSDEYQQLRNSLFEKGKFLKIADSSKLLMHTIGETAWIILKIIAKNPDVDTVLEISPLSDLDTIQIITDLYKSGAILISNDEP